MHTNYYFLKKLVPELEQTISGSILVSCFSQNRDELVLQFQKNSSHFFIHAILRRDFTILTFPQEFRRSRKNSANIFTEAIGYAIRRIVMYQNERCFQLELGDFQMLFKMFGFHSNLILYQNGQPIALFKNNLEKDRNLSLRDLDRPILRSFSEFEKSGYDYKTLFPTFGKIVGEYLKESGYDNLPPTEQWKMLEMVESRLLNPQYYRLELSKPTLSLLPIGKYQLLDNHPVKAINQFYHQFSKKFYLGIEKNQILRKLDKIERRNFNYLLKTRKKLEDIVGATKYSQIADIIMANLPNITQGQAEIELLDFYNNRPITIKLNKKLSPPKNAEALYRKSKNQSIEIQNISNNIANRESEQKVVHKSQKEIQKIGNLKELRSYLEANKLVQVVEREQVPLPYRSYSVGGYQIWVGKSAKSNDLMLREFSWKEDLWLHARDLAGSHVIIKHQSGRNFPQHVKERAAQLAAWNSKGKTNSMCPVIITPRKFVRKPKGALPGVVVVEKEQVILVEPSGPSNLK